MAVAGQPGSGCPATHAPFPCPVEGGSIVTRLITNPRFWVLTFVLTWLALITVLIALGPAAPDGGTGAPH